MPTYIIIDNRQEEIVEKTYSNLIYENEYKDNSVSITLSANLF